MYCPKCGNEINNSSNYCDNCGNQIKVVNSNEGIFANLSDFKYKRNWIQAIGFCIVYSLLAMLIAFIFGVVAFALGVLDNCIYSEILGLIGCLYFMAISITVFYKKRLFKNAIAIILFILSIILIILSGIIGLIPVAYMTTFDEQTASK